MTCRSAFTALVFAAILTGCGSKDLAKEQAKSLLNDYFDKNTTNQPLLTGMASLGQSSEAEYFATPGGKYQKALEADGLIEGKLSTGDRLNKRTYVLSKRGQLQLQNWIERRRPSHFAVRLKAMSLKRQLSKGRRFRPARS